MISMVECTRFASLGTARERDEEAAGQAAEYRISGEVDGKIEEWGPGDWMRPLGDVEIMFALGGYLKSLNTVQAVWVSSEQPLTRQLVRGALQHLVQRIPILNICIQRRGSSLWYRRTQKTVIDFDVCHGDAMEVFHEVTRGTYDLGKGPLWRARMVPLAPGSASPRGVVANNQAMIVFGVLHAVTDATTNLVICKELINIINDMLQGRPISSPSYPLTAPHAEKLVNSSKTFLCKYFWKRFFKVIVMDFNKKTTFRGLMPLAKNYVVETRIVNHIFTEDVTSKFIKRCKENNATVHSCIVTAANAAYFDVALQKSKNSLDKVNMYYTDCINLRRYYPERQKEHMGCHITMHERKTTITLDDKMDFWKTVRSSKASLHEDLTGRACLDIMPIIKWVVIVFPFNIYRNRKGTINVTDSHYITTNMGDVTGIMGDTAPSDPVHLTDIFRTTNGEFAGHLFTLTCHTFRKRLYLSMDYYANKVPETLAQEIFGNLRDKIICLAEKGELY